MPKFNVKPSTYKLGFKVKILHSGDTEFLDRCVEKHQYQKCPKITFKKMMLFFLIVLLQANIRTTPFDQKSPLQLEVGVLR